MRPFLTALSLLCAVAAQLAAQPALIARLDSLVRAEMNDAHLAGLSVAVLRGRDTLLNRAYGFADLSLEVPASPSTTYRFTGLAIAAAVMREVELGRLKLDEDVSRLLPEFPWQGRRVTLRQLMDATSGLQDFHYIGDAYEGAIGVPKAPDQVTAIFAGQPFTHEPGAQLQWTTSGFHLAGMLVERSSGKPFAEYLREHVIAPLGLKRTFYCDDRTITPGLARHYVYQSGGFANGRMMSATMYPYLSTLCTTASDALSITRAFRDGRLLKGESWTAMSTPVGAAASSQTPRGVGLRISMEETHRWYGITGSLAGFGFASADFIEDSLTIVVLTNSSSQAPGRMIRVLARAVFGLSPLPPFTTFGGAAAPVERTPLTAAEQQKYVGTYRTTLVNPPPQYAGYVRHARVFTFNGRLWIQFTGEEAHPLLHTEGDAFVSRVGSGSFVVEAGRATQIEWRNGGMVGRGPRIP
jgi:CubicO group peptidase (beta-lactamase class C family)